MNRTTPYLIDPPQPPRPIDTGGDDAIDIAAIVKGNERYIFLYDAASRAECLRTLGRFASNPELSFTWLDAATLSQRIRPTPTT